MDNRGVYSLEDVLGNFPNSREAVALIAAALRIAGTPVDDGDDDGRRDAIGELMETVSPAVRTRVCVLAGVLGELSRAIRSVAIETKARLADPDISSGDAIVTPDGWLVVTMDGKEIGRVPYDPHRQDGTEAELSRDILREYVRMHGRGDLEVANLATPLPKPGARTVIAIVDDADDLAPDDAIDTGPSSTH